MGKSLLRLWLGLSLLAGVPGVLAAPQSESITQEQAEAILKELREIRQLLEQMVKANAARPPAAAPATAGKTAPPAAAVKVKVSVGDSYALGRADAPVTLVEFTDYQCAYCQRFHLNTFEELKKNYIDTGTVRFLSRDLPLSFHQNALQAAHAARCAGEQGKFWEMRHVLLANATRLEREAIFQYAQEVGLEAKKFRACVESEKYKGEIEKDIAEATAVGISGTPTFVLAPTAAGQLEGVRIVGAQPYAAFEARIKELLPKKPTN